MSKFQPGDRVVIIAPKSLFKGRAGEVESQRPGSTHVVVLDDKEGLAPFFDPEGRMPFREYELAPAPAGSAK